MITLGIDIGSRNTKIALYDTKTKALLHSAWRSTDVKPLTTVEELIAQVKQTRALSKIEKVGCTGYGRKLYPYADKVLSEISCHTCGVRFFYPNARTIIDIGGQDSKIISLDPLGRIQDFVMNDKCAAGTGRFLEMTAIRLECSLDELSRLAETSTEQLAISSTCVVFAESEIIGLIAEDHSPSAIARAIHLSISKRILTQISALEYYEPIVFTGGVAQNQDLANCLALELNQPIIVASDPEITGALGAAILSVES